MTIMLFVYYVDNGTQANILSSADKLAVGLSAEPSAFDTYKDGEHL